MQKKVQRKCKRKCSCWIGAKICLVSWYRNRAVVSQTVFRETTAPQRISSMSDDRQKKQYRLPVHPVCGGLEPEVALSFFDFLQVFFTDSMFGWVCDFWQLFCDHFFAHCFCFWRSVVFQIFF